MSRRREIVIWILINIVLALAFAFVSNWLRNIGAGISFRYNSGVIFGVTLLILNVFRMYMAVHLRALYGTIIVANYIAIFATGDYSFVWSVVNMIRLL